MSRPLFVLMLLAGSVVGGEETVRLDALDLQHVRQGWGRARAKRSVQDAPLLIGGARFDRGVRTHAESGWTLQLDGATEFTAKVGSATEFAPRAAAFDSSLSETERPCGAAASCDPAMRREAFASRWLA